MAALLRSPIFRYRSIVPKPLSRCNTASRFFATTIRAQSNLIGVAAALKAQSDPSLKPKATLFSEFSLDGRVAVVSGGKQGLGLEMAMALSEAGATVYCMDLQATPGAEFNATRDYVRKLGRKMEYVSVDVTKQKEVWDAVESIGTQEGRVDACIAAAGILNGSHCLEYKDVDFQKVMDVNTNGVLYTAQAAGRQMDRYKIPGSIILIASMSGSLTNRNQHGGAHPWVAYNTSKSAVIQMARSMACELGPKGIRVNSLSPGHIYTAMTAAYLETVPGLGDEWAKLNPLGRLGRSDELRGVVSWLASDASTFCTGSDILVTGGHHAW
ncbi:NAD-binding protein [Sistotremastrum niveocremeum HHB9708]|uniref:NAD-binding protein n=1 Tax=Sistotremastrum niveocremeum HHB9708 TaxID=1314777 RepID=A0A164QQQ8_9AGAM|nr:NAD-binding protein [Sistotremastrum niveocremeum HHB9708]